MMERAKYLQAAEALVKLVGNLFVMPSVVKRDFVHDFLNRDDAVSFYRQFVFHTHPIGGAEGEEFSVISVHL